MPEITLSIGGFVKRMHVAEDIYMRGVVRVAIVKPLCLYAMSSEEIPTNPIDCTIDFYRADDGVFYA